MDSLLKFSHAILFDNNVLNTITQCGHDRRYEHIQDFIEAKTPLVRDSKLLVHTTELLLLEHLGIEPSLYPKFSDSELRSIRPEELHKHVFYRAFEHFQSLPELSAGHFLKRYEIQMQSRSPASSAFYSNIISTALDEKFPLRAQNFLALDARSGFEFRKFLKGDLLKAALSDPVLDLFRASRAGFTVSSARGVFEFASQMRRDNRNQKFSEEVKKVLDGKWKLSPVGDRGDLV